MTEQLTVEDKLLALKKKYYRSLPDKLVTIQTIWQQYENQRIFADNALETALHKLAGSAGMYDEAELGRIARDAELLVADCSRSGNSLDENNVIKISESLNKLKDKIEQLSH